MTSSPAQAPLNFFRALQMNDYAQAWENLTERSQTSIVRILANSWKSHSLEELSEMFAQGQAVAKTYWEQFCQSLELQTWLSQSYQQLGASGSEVIVKTSPAGVHLLVYKQGEQWKFGYIETFLDQQ